MHDVCYVCPVINVPHVNRFSSFMASCLLLDISNVMSLIIQIATDNVTTSLIPARRFLLCPSNRPHRSPRRNNTSPQTHHKTANRRRPYIKAICPLTLSVFSLINIVGTQKKQIKLNSKQPHGQKGWVVRFPGTSQTT